MPSSLITLTVLDIHNKLLEILTPLFDDQDADLLAKIFIQSELDGVTTHGLARFPRFINEIKGGSIKPKEQCQMIKSFGGWEMWDGKSAPGPLNAVHATQRGISLAQTHGISCVGLRNTNHWLRPGYYAKLAAAEGCALIAWSNTLPNMRGHHLTHTSLSNTPITLGLPSDNNQGQLIITDLALSQFSYGKLANFADENNALPVDGGYSQDHQPTRDASAIIAEQSASAIGFWKGSALAIVLDFLAAFLSGGQSVFEIGLKETEQNVSQVFITIALDKLWEEPEYTTRLTELKAQLRSVNADIRIPGSQLVANGRLDFQQQLHIANDIWQAVVACKS